MRSLNWKTVTILVTLVVVGGCQETVSAPQGSSTGPASIMLAPAGSPQLSLGEKADDSGDIDFTVTPNGGTFLLGNHAVVFPSRSICDPSVSSYGAGTWDAPCVALKGALRIHAKIRTAKLGTWVDFSPSLRFVPSSEPAQWVYIYLYSPSFLGASDLSKYSILWAPAIGSDGVNDMAGDATLRTYVDTHKGVAMRRIKHFTGYYASTGRTCDPALELDCYPAP